MNSFTSLTLWRTRVVKRAWWLNGLLIAALALGPYHWAGGAWSDSDSDGADDTFTTASGTSYTLADLNAQSADPDADGAYNEEELAYGSDPFDYDTDDDGLKDGDEIHLANEQGGFGFSLTNWDSDGDFISDYDEYYGCDWVFYLDGQVPNFTNASYWDYDGDGIANPSDPYPQDPNNNDGDGDGIDDAVDPDTGSAENYSWINYNSWWGNALGDDDGDAILNYWDDDPWNSSNGSNDTDSDGIENGADPFPDDYANGSGVNGIYWYGDVFGDADSDGIMNFEDSDPYGGGGTSETQDYGPWNSDGDDFDSDLDPDDTDPTNYSWYNQTPWYGLALEDSDNDGTENYWDSWPDDPFDGDDDVDDDLILNGDDPFPRDNSNYSPLNAVTWGAAVLDDDDGDGALNWNDLYPNDEFDGLEDYDGDSILNGDDPFPRDGSNTSPVNYITWGSDVNGDDDADGIVNGVDETPYPEEATDTDSDGIPDADDPYPDDDTNTSTVNYVTWGANVLGNEDNDSTPNYADEWPYDPYDGDSDIDDDGIDNGVDPAPTDSANYSFSNNTSWYSAALDDNDADGVANFYDSDPTTGGAADTDNDGFPDVSDPAPTDPSNWSPANYNLWYWDALGDSDSDSIPNFYDDSPWPPPPTQDSDLDGLNDEEEAQYGTDIYTRDTDGDDLSDGEEVWAYATNPMDAYSISESDGYGQLYLDSELVNQDDFDSDGLPDLIEIHYNLDPYDTTVNHGLQDLDNNGVNNLTQHLSLKALDADLERYDQDGDGMSDVFEDTFQLAKGNFNDAVEDPDQDGVMNYEEMTLLLNPNVADTRATQGSDPQPLGDMLQLMIAVRYSEEGSIPPTVDANTNGIPDWADALTGAPVAPEYYHFERLTAHDVDSDAMPDVWEHLYGRWKYHQDGLQIRKDDAADDADDDTLTNLTEYHLGTNPLAGDSDDNNITDDLEDTDGDGLTNAHEQSLGTQGWNADTDGDGLGDALELRLGLDPLAQYSGGGALADGLRDFDGDAIGNLVEVNLGLNPAVGNWGDSDEDGISDVAEVALGTNPLEWDTDGDSASDVMEMESQNDPLSAAGNNAWARLSIANF